MTRELVEELAEIMGEHFAWIADQKKAEMQRTAEVLQKFHGVVLYHPRGCELHLPSRKKRNFHPARV